MTNIYTQHDTKHDTKHNTKHNTKNDTIHIETLTIWMKKKPKHKGENKCRNYKAKLKG